MKQIFNKLYLKYYAIMSWRAFLHKYSTICCHYPSFPTSSNVDPKQTSNYHFISHMIEVPEIFLLHNFLIFQQFLILSQLLVFLLPSKLKDKSTFRLFFIDLSLVSGSSWGILLSNYIDRQQNFHYNFFIKIRNEIKI